MIPHPSFHSSRTIPTVLRGSRAPWRKIAAALLGAVVALGLSQATVFAGTSIKQNNSTNLNLAGSWNTLPGAGDIAQWDATVLGTNSPVLGADLSWLGLKIVSPGGLVTLGAGNTLTIGASGIDLSTATQSLTLNCGLTLQGLQSWKAAASRTLNVAGTFTRTGAVVDFTNFNASAILSGITNDATGMLGTWATTGATTSLNYVKNTAGVISAYTGQTAATAADLSNVTNPAINYSFAAAATLTGTITANTLRYTGGAATVTNNGNSITLNGLMNAGSASTLFISGTGNLVIGANKELVVAASKDTTITSKIVDNPGGASSLTYSGAGSNFTLSGSNTYTGGTVVNAGSLTAGSGSSLGAAGFVNVTVQSGATLVTNNLQFTGNLTLNGGTVSATNGNSQDVWNGPITLGATSTIDVGSSDGVLTVNGTVSGPGGLTKVGTSGRVTFLKGINTYTGPTTVSQGILQFKNSLYGNDTAQWTPANISVSSGAILMLSVGGTNDFTTAQAGTLVTNLTTGVNNNGLKAGSSFGIDTANATSTVNITAAITDSTGTGGGAVGLRKNSNGTLQLSASNTYSGQTILDLGTLSVASFNSVATTGSLGTVHSASSSLGAPTTVANGTIEIGKKSYGGATILYTGTGETTDRVISFQGQNSTSIIDQSGTGLLKLTSAFNMGGYNKTIQLQGSTAGTGEIAGAIGNASSTLVTKSGTGTWTLSGVNSYTGTTNVTAGILACSSAASLGSGPLNINTGAKLALNYIGTGQVASLKYNSGTAQANGTYGSTASSATFKNDTYFTGTGTVTVGPLAAVTTTTLAQTGGTAPSTLGAAITFTATVTGSAPTGNVSFYAGASLIGTSALNGSFQASVTTSSLAIGSYNITAIYGSDVNNQVSSSSGLAIQVVASNVILSFVFPGLPATTITGTAISVTVPYSTVVTALAPTYTMSAGATGNPVPGTVRDFTTPKTYTITAPDLSFQTYTVTVIKSAPSTAKNMLTFVFPGLPATTISGTNIGVNVPFGTALTALAPTYTVSPFATATPASGTVRNFATPQSYTVTAEDGSSQTYTVTVTVSASIFTWNTAVAGNWSDSSKWTNNQSDGTAPVAAGQTDYTLNFNQAGTYTVTNDRNAGFLLNQLNVSGGVTLAGNSLAFSANGATLPQINQNSASSVAIGVPVALAANVTLGGSGAGQVTVSAQISGSGTLTKNSSGSLNLSSANTYSGGTVINAGSLDLPNNGNSLLGTGAVTVNTGAALNLNGNGNLANAFTFNGASVGNGNSFTAYISGPVTMAATSSFDLYTTGQMGIGGNISGPGGLTKKGTSGSAFYLTGTNSFAGIVSVQAGTIQAASLNRVSGGTATSNLGAPTTVANGTIALGSGNTVGTFLYTGPGETTDRVIKMAGTTGGATLAQSGVNGGLPATRGVTGLLKFTSDISIPGTASTDNRKTLTLTQVDTTLTGPTVGSGEISGSIGDSLIGTAGQLATSVTKAGPGVWTLSGVNTYTGATKIQAGTLVFAKSNALGGGSLDISTSAKAQLDYIGTRQISALTYNAGAAQPNGTYGSTSSIATNKDDTRFSGLGTVTVGTITAPSTTTLARTSGTSPSNGGTALTFTATVAGSSPTGSVVFYDGLTALGTVALNGSAQASLSTSKLTAAVHEITAWYLGNGSNAPSVSAPLIQTVVETRPATTTTQALTSGSNPSSFGGSVTFTATVTGTAPTGMVTFYDGTVALGGSALSGSAQASWSVSNLASGWHPITSQYEGDANNAPSATATSMFQTVNPPAGNGKVKVFILAGQSNMVGKGRVETGRDPNNIANTSLVGGLGSLRNMLNNNPNKYGYLADPAHLTAEGNPGWLTRSDVWVTYWGESNAENRRGNLDADFGDGGGQGRIGPEYGFGLVAGSQLADQVLIIKYAFGGKSLAVDYRPPSSGGTVGPYYTDMLARVNQVLSNLSTYFPAYTGGGYEIVGLGWHQGYNDRINTGYAAEYEANMTNFIKDVRTALGVPNLPFSIGNTGMAVAPTDAGALTVIAAQAAVANPAMHPEFAGTVSTVETRVFDYGELLGGSSEGYHWYWNAESYFNIGDSMGKAMMALLPPLSSAKSILTFIFPGQPATTISGTNISVTVPYGTSVTAFAPTYTLSALATASPVSGATGNFITPQTYTVTAQDLSTQVYTVTVTVAPPSYSDWATAQGLTSGVNDDPLADPDGDGVCNLLEFTLGGTPMVSSQAILPKLNPSGNNWLFEYDRSDLSLPPATTQVVEYGSDLAGWIPVTIPTRSAGIVTIAPGSPSDHVTVTIPSPVAKGFVRLKVSK